MPFNYLKTVQYYETDAMGVVHHSNYLRYFEEARVAWLKTSDLLQIHAPFTDLTFAVVASDCAHHSVCRFGDELSIRLQVRQEGAKIRFRYAVYAAQGAASKAALVASEHTLHVALDRNFRVCRLPTAVKAQLAREMWIETWP